MTANESACRFGPDGRLCGILTEPAAPRRRTAMVLVSAGLTPKFGPFRLYAELARRLSHAGISTLRFDLGGVGDSGRGQDAILLDERTRLEIGAAVDWLKAHGELDSLVLGGLCSGAEDSFRYAEHDPRVTGVVLIDPFAYRTPGFGWRHLRHRAARRLLRAVGLYRPCAREAVTGDALAARSLVNYEHMPQPESQRILRSLLKRGARVHFVYTGGMRESFNHERQLRAMFRDVDFDDRVLVDHFPRLDHTQLLERDRRTIVEAIARRFAA